MAKPYRFGVEPITCHAWNKDQTRVYYYSTHIFDYLLLDFD